MDRFARDSVLRSTIREACPCLFYAILIQASLGEILFGLIMVLTFTLGAGIAVRAGEGAGDARELLYAAIGCNIAWGIIDAVLYVMGQVFARSRRGRLLRAINAASDETAALAAIRAELEPVLSRSRRKRIAINCIVACMHWLPAPNRPRRG